MQKATWYYPDPKSPLTESEIKEMETCGLKTIFCEASNEQELINLHNMLGSGIDIHGEFGLEKLYHNAFKTPPPEAKPLNPAAYLALYPQGVIPYRLSCWSAVTDPAPLAKWISDFIKRHPYIKGINIDALRYTNTYFLKDNPCNCDGCRSRRKPWLGHDLLTADDERDPSFGYMEVKSKIEVMTRITSALSKSAHESGIEFSIDPRAVFSGRDIEFDQPPTWGYGPAIYEGQDWVSWCRGGMLDSIHIMNYTTEVARFKRLAEQHQILLFGSSSQIFEGIGIMSSAGKMSPKTFEQQLEIVRSLKFAGVTLFSWKDTSKKHREVLARA